MGSLSDLNTYSPNFDMPMNTILTTVAGESPFTGLEAIPEEQVPPGTVDLRAQLRILRQKRNDTMSRIPAIISALRDAMKEESGAIRETKFVGCIDMMEQLGD